MAVTNRTSQYWHETLKGFSVASPLIIDKSHTETSIRPSGNYESVHIELSDRHIEKIASFNKRNDLDTKTLLHGIWASLFFRYGAGDEIVYGCVNGGRAKTPVPVRVKISSRVTASSWLHELQSYLKEASQYFETPLDVIHELSGFDEDTPIFRSAIDLSEEAFDASGFAKMGCPLVFKPDLRSVAGELSIYFDASFFEYDAVKRMLGHIDMLLSGILENEQACVADIAMLTTAEFNQIVYAWNRTQTDYPSATCLHQLFEEQVEQDPEAVALIFRDQHLTYAELNQHANQLAHYLISLGIGPDRLVGVCMERCLEMSIALLAILKAGGAYVPFDPAFPESRLAFMLEDTQAEVVLTQAHLRGRISSEKVKILCLDDDTESWAHQEITNPEPALDADNLFNVMFTSGSTGKPKGVMVPHRGIINRLQWMQDAYPLDINDRVLQKTPYSFDVSVWELFWPLITGAILVYPEPEGHKDPEYLRDLIIEQGITTLHFVPSMLNVFLQIPDLEQCTSVSRVFCSGEALQPEQERMFFVRLRNAELHNLYGPTEASVDVSYFACQPDSKYSTVPIGRPVANTQLHILDANLNPLPLGVTGELFIGGVQLARGYLNLNDLTQSTFIENPFFEEGHPSKRLYKTGDQARYLQDGNIEFLGRLDSQVKIRGLRIELGEIEAALNESDKVQDSVVVMHEDTLGNKRIAAYIVPELKHVESAQEETRVSQIETIHAEINVQEFASKPLRGELLHKLLPELRESLKTVLPDYMVPSDFMLIKQIPLNSNGKLDRKALPSPDTKVSKQGNYLPADNIIEETLVSIWSDVLGLDRVSVTDNFFELGGDSILGMQVVIRARKCNLDVTLSQLFQHHTIREVSKRVEWRLDSGTSGEGTRTENNLEAIKRIDRSGPLELSMGQHQLWFLSRLESNTAAYVVSYSIRLLGPLDVRLLEKSLNRIIERHEILRTTYYEVDGKPLQAVSQRSLFRLPMTDLTTNASSEKNAEVSRIASIEAGTPFDIAREHCLRAQIVKLSKEEHVLLLSLHHIAFDGWSVGVLFRELTEYYTAYQTGTEANVPRLPIQYADYASWQRKWLETDEFKKQLNYWKTKLDGELPVFELPTDRVRPSVQTFNGELKVFELDRNLTQSLKDLSRRHGCTLFMTLLGAYYVLLSRYSGQNDIIIGSPVANRNAEEIENLVGFFMNSVALRILPSSDPTFLQLLNCVRETTLEALANQAVPFGTLVEELRPERSLSHNPIYQVMFVLQNSPLPSCEFSGISVSSHEIDGGTALFDLTLNMWEEENGLNGYFAFNTDLFDTETIERMFGHYEALLRDIVVSPEKKICHLQLLKKDELERILYGWNDTYSDFPDQLCIHELFEERAESSPAVIAVSCPGGARLTYRELNLRANQLSHCLLSLGVQCNEFVGICVERSIEMVVGILGIIKAGAAYAPIDPRYPSERIAYMLKDTGAKIVLSQAHLVDGLPLSGLKTLCLDSDWQDISNYGTGNTNADVCADDPVYIIYTSGSTGTPKGVPITHRNLVHSTDARFKYYPDSVTGFVLLSSFAFDSSVAGLFWTLCQGGTLTLPELGAEQDIKRIVENVETSKASHLLTLPSLYHLLLDAGKSGQLESLKTVIVAGEACPKELIAHHYKVLPDATLYNEYGPTEGTVWSTVYKTEKDDPFNSVPIGRPIPNMNVYILDKTRQAVPVGVEGEIYISGEGVAQGYHGQTDVTDEKFVSNDFPKSKWDKMYASGDLARYRPDGNIEFLGRLDHQVKIRGYRIELGEIETVINKHPLVDDVVVIAREGTSDSKSFDDGKRIDNTDPEDLQGIAELMYSLGSSQANKMLEEVEKIPVKDINVSLRA